jgi:hypothetical protein
MFGTIFEIYYIYNTQIRFIDIVIEESIIDRFNYYKNKYQTETNYVSINYYFKKYGIENFKCKEIKKYEIVDYQHLNVLKQLWINKLQCINTFMVFSIKFLTYNQYIYRLIFVKKRYNNRSYKIKNKNGLRKYSDKYYKKNKNDILERLKQRTICKICNKIFSKGYIIRHNKTYYHQYNSNKLCS